MDAPSGQSPTPLLIIGSLLAIYITSKVIDVFRGVKKTIGIPGYIRPLFPYSPLGLVLPTSWFSPGYYFLWRWRHINYKRFNESELFSFVGIFPGGTSMLFTRNVDIMRQVAGGARVDFHKPLSASRGILKWGMNVLAAEGGAEWRKHRKVMGPAFSNEIYRNVWKKSAEVYREMVAAEGWSGNNNKFNKVDAVQDLTVKLTLLVIGACGFGLDFRWSDPEVAADGTVSLSRVLHLVNDRQELMFLPQWILNLPIKYFREHREAHARLDQWMRDQIAERKALIRGTTSDSSSSTDLGGKSDCFTLFVKANELDEDETGRSMGGVRLTDEELMGNVYILLLAGHETTAHSLAVTLAYLSINQDCQDEVVDQILEVVGRHREPQFEDYNKLNKVLAAFYEGLRLYPTVHIMLRESTTDTLLKVPNPPGEEGHTTLAVPKGTMVVVDMIGAQYNTRYFDEPEKYKPSRWHSMPNDSEAYTAFSIGPRACPGRKFATIEVVSFLTLLLRDWKIEPLLKDGEDLAQWKSRVFEAKLTFTLGVQNVSLKFTSRER